MPIRPGATLLVEGGSVLFVHGLDRAGDAPRREDVGVAGLGVAHDGLARLQGLRNPEIVERQGVEVLLVVELRVRPRKERRLDLGDLLPRPDHTSNAPTGPLDGAVDQLPRTRRRLHDDVAVPEVGGDRGDLLAFEPRAIGPLVRPPAIDEPTQPRVPQQEHRGRQAWGEKALEGLPIGGAQRSYSGLPHKRLLSPQPLRNPSPERHRCRRRDRPRERAGPMVWLGRTRNGSKRTEVALRRQGHSSRALASARPTLRRGEPPHTLRYLRRGNVHRVSPTMHPHIP